MSNLAKYSAYTFLLLAVALNFYFSQLTFIDVPYRDSWQLISYNFISDYPWRWLLAAHNEHIISTTKFLILVLYKINSWNVSVHLYLNYLFYLFSLFFLFSLLKQSVEKKLLPILILSFVFCFSDLNWENLTWEFQSTFHLCLFFSFAYLLVLFKKEFLWKEAFFAIVLNLLAVFSLSSAAVSGVLVSFFFLISRKEVSLKLRLITFSGFLLSSIAWFCLVNISSGEAKIYPNKLAFWDFLLNLSSFGFGFETYSWIIGLLCISSFLFFLIKRFDVKLIAVSIFILSTIAIIAVGRASQSDIQIWSKGGRYFEVAMLLVPLNAAACLSASKNMYLRLIFSLLIPIIGFSNNWSYPNFTYVASQKEKGLSCLKREDKNKFKCPEIWGEVINPKLKISKDIHLSFIRN